jgi:hypothetical protein
LPRHELLFGHERKKRNISESFHALEQECLRQRQQIRQQPESTGYTRRNLTEQGVADVHEHSLAVPGGEESPDLESLALLVASQNRCVAVVERAEKIESRS